MQGSPGFSLPWPAGRDAASAAGINALVMAHAPMGIAVVDAEGIYRSVNPAHCALYGYSADELLGRSFTVVVPPERRALAMARHRAFMAGAAPLAGEYQVQHRDGRVFDVLLHSVAVQGDGGQPMRLVYVLDITERKQAERALQAKQQFLQSVLDALAAHVCVLDARGVVLAVNRAWQAFGEANGAPADYSAVGRSYLSACCAADGTPLDADAGGVPPGEFAARLQQVLDGRLDGFQAEYPCDTAQGRLWFLARVTRMADDGVPRIVVAHDNITALRQALDTLRDSEALQRDLAASIPGAMFRLQQQEGRWRFTYVSPGITALFGLTPAQVQADIRALGRQILPDDLAAHDAIIRAAVRAGQPFEQEYRIRSTDGQLKWVHAKALPKPVDDSASGALVWTGMLQDVSGRKQLEAVLRGSEERYRTLFETVPQGVVYQDAQGRITSANPAAQRILGRTLAQMQGQQAADPGWQAEQEDGTPLPASQHPAAIALRTGVPVTDVVMGLPVPGRGMVWLLVSAIPLKRHGVVEEVYASFEDITERMLLSRELKQQASTDYLTGVANRRSLMQRLALEFERVKRGHADHHRCTVLAVDLDLFKQVNDNHGHAAGDAVLQQVAALMRRLTRQHDLVARSGGEEFTLLLPEAGPDDGLALAERLRAGLRAQPVRHGDLQLAVTVSVGVSAILPDDPNLDAVLARADGALYAAKAAGRDQVCVAPLPG